MTGRSDQPRNGLPVLDERGGKRGESERIRQVPSLFSPYPAKSKFSNRNQESFRIALFGTDETGLLDRTMQKRSTSTGG
ncbi:hypothetical protein CGRA01v4_06015 [Colletotrichum graminicola]|nr:hypothetical protein CGRA01v4_06015 [Colletotrichum graminicola]